MTNLLSQNSLVQGILTFGFIGLFGVFLILATAYAARFASAAMSGVSASMMSPLGALFGLIAAFLGASVWQNHGEAVVAANLEARSLSEAWITASDLPDPLRSNVQRNIDSYVNSVVSEEWPIMTSISSLDNPISNKARVYLSNAIRQLVANDRTPSIALSSTAQELRTAFSARSRRLDVALHRISGLQFASTLALGLLLMTLVAIVHHTARHAQITGVTLAGLAVAITIGSIVVHDDPFGGYLAVTSADFGHIFEYRTTQAGRS